MKKTTKRLLACASLIFWTTSSSARRLSPESWEVSNPRLIDEEQIGYYQNEMSTRHSSRGERLGVRDIDNEHYWKPFLRAVSKDERQLDQTCSLQISISCITILLNGNPVSCTEIPQYSWSPEEGCEATLHYSIYVVNSGSLYVDIEAVKVRNHARHVDLTKRTKLLPPGFGLPISNKVTVDVCDNLKAVGAEITEGDIPGVTEVAVRGTAKNDGSSCFSSAEYIIETSSEVDPVLPAAPITAPTDFFNGMPSAMPHIDAALAPTGEPTAFPSSTPTEKPSSLPSSSPSQVPTSTPSSLPTDALSDMPSLENSLSPSLKPTNIPTGSPSGVPTKEPTAAPTIVPTTTPSAVPTKIPTVPPTFFPTKNPTLSPTSSPNSLRPTNVPTARHSAGSSVTPTQNPTPAPTGTPTVLPTKNPTIIPTEPPTIFTSNTPSSSTHIPSLSPSVVAEITPAETSAVVPPPAEQRTGIDGESEPVTVDVPMTSFYLSLTPGSELLDSEELGHFNKWLDDHLLSVLNQNYSIISIGIDTVVKSQIISNNLLYEGITDLGLHIEKSARITSQNSLVPIPETSNLDAALSSIFESDEKKSALISSLQNLETLRALADIRFELEKSNSPSNFAQAGKNTATLNKETVNDDSLFGRKPLRIGLIAAAGAVFVATAALIGWRCSRGRNRGIRKRDISTTLVMADLKH